MATFDQMYPDKFQTHLTSELPKARKQLPYVSKRESPMNRSLLDGALSGGTSFLSQVATESVYSESKTNSGTSWKYTQLIQT